jgi:hypothetical protein
MALLITGPIQYRILHPDKSVAVNSYMNWRSLHDGDRRQEFCLEFVTGIKQKLGLRNLQENL